MIQQRSTVQDDWGGSVEAWLDVGTAWAAIEDIKGREFFAAQAAQSQVETRIRVRHMKTALASWRVLHDLVAYEVQYIIHDGTKETHLMCRRV